jgi:hypothetical protein
MKEWGRNWKLIEIYLKQPSDLIWEAYGPWDLKTNIQGVYFKKPSAVCLNRFV